MLIRLYLPFALASRKCLLSNQFAVRRGPLGGGSRLAYIGPYCIRATGDIVLDSVAPGLHRGLISYYLRVESERLDMGFSFEEYP
jgi:hypothetical protein